MWLSSIDAEGLIRMLRFCAIQWYLCHTPKIKTFFFFHLEILIFLYFFSFNLSLPIASAFFLPLLPIASAVASAFLLSLLPPQKVASEKKALLKTEHFGSLATFRSMGQSMGKKLNSRQRCASDVAGDVAGDKSLATGVHFCFGPCTFINSF